MNNEARVIQCVLSILYTIRSHYFTEGEIDKLNELLNKAIQGKYLSKEEKDYLKEQTMKYAMFIDEILNEEYENRIGKIAIMNDLCYNYFKTESEILLLQNKDINDCVKSINIINKDIEQFNKNYTNEKFLNKIEGKYNTLVDHFFNVINIPSCMNKSALNP